MKASILDYVRTSLDQAIWDVQEDTIKMKPEVRLQILDIAASALADFDIPESAVKGLFVYGSILTNQYNDKTDIDCRILLYKDKMDDLYPNLTGDDIFDYLEKVLHGQKVRGTQHPLNYSVIIEGEQEELGQTEYDPVYDVINDKILRDPVFTDESFDPDDEFFQERDQVEETMKYLDELLRQAKTKTIDYAVLKDAVGKVKDPKKLKQRLENKLAEIEQGIEQLVAEYEEIKEERTKSLSENSEESHHALPGNVKHKYLERYQYLDILKKLKHILKGGVSPKEIPDVADALRIAQAKKNAGKHPKDMTFEEFIQFSVPGEGDRSRHPKDVERLRGESSTLYDYANDEWVLKDWLGAWSSVEDVSHLVPIVKANQPIKIYRATDTEEIIFPGAYVTPSKKYAELHAELVISGEHLFDPKEAKILEAEAFPDELIPVNPLEFFYAPKSVEDWHKKLISSIKVTGLAFKWKPENVGPTYEGIIQYPGFHTTESFDIASMYAVGRVHQSYTETDEHGVNYVTDYPAVVAVDMAGFEAKVDYDAVEMVLDVLKTQLDYFLQELSEEDTDEIIEDKLYRYIEFAEDSRDMPAEPLDFLSENTFAHFSNPLNYISNSPNAAQIIREYQKSGAVPDDVLMKATDQFRYTEDVSEGRIRQVWYIQPVANVIVTYEDEEDKYDKEYPNFDILGEDDTVGGSWRPKETLVYEESAAEQLDLPGVDQPQRRVQYHGTTYKRLLQIAPDLPLPQPPTPPYRDGG